MLFIELRLSDIPPDKFCSVFILTDADYHDYISEVGHVVFLRYDKRDNRLNTLNPSESYNFGDCKGMTFERVVISTTAKTLKDHIVKGTNLANLTKAKYYIALTRARKSVTIVMDRLPKIAGFCETEVMCNGKKIKMLKYVAHQQGVDFVGSG